MEMNEKYSFFEYNVSFLNKRLWWSWFLIRSQILVKKHTLSVNILGKNNTLNKYTIMLTGVQEMTITFDNKYFCMHWIETIANSAKYM